VSNSKKRGVMLTGLEIDEFQDVELIDAFRKIFT